MTTRAAVRASRSSAFDDSALAALSSAGGGWLLDRFFAARVSFVLLSTAAFGTFLLSGADSLLIGVIAAILIGLGMGGEAEVTPYLLSRYFGLRSFSVLYGLTWTFYAVAERSVPCSWARPST